MKKGRALKFLMAMLIVFIIVSLAVVPALAASSDGEVQIGTVQEFSLGMLVSIAGLAGIVVVMVEVTKFLSPWKQINPKYYCAGWTLLFMAARLMWVVPPTGPSDYFEAFVNLFIVMGLATGGFEYVAKPVERWAMRKVEAKQQGDKTSDEAAGETEIAEEVEDV